MAHPEQLTPSGGRSFEPRLRLQGLLHRRRQQRLLAGGAAPCTVVGSTLGLPQMKEGVEASVWVGGTCRGFAGRRRKGHQKFRVEKDDEQRCYRASSLLTPEPTGLTTWLG